jgi:thiol-disulfide isomerase/thioredoxin
MRRYGTTGMLSAIGVLVFLSVLGITTHRWKRWRMEHASLAKPGPRFVVPDVFNKPVKFPSDEGKVLLLHLWATWCPSCQTEIPALLDLQRRYQPRGFEMVGFSIDHDADLVRQFYRRYNLNYPVVMLDPEVEQFLEVALDIPHGQVADRVPIPTSILIGRDGRISGVYVGKDAKVLERPLDQLLASGPHTSVGTQVPEPTFKCLSSYPDLASLAMQRTKLIPTIPGT